MLPLLRFLAACLLICLGSCGEMVVKSPASRESVSADDQSWKAFQKALERRDAVKVASMTEFPLPTDFEGLEGFDGIGSRKTFARDFGTFFPQEVIRTLLEFSPSAGEIRSKSWIVAHNEPHEVSEMEWSMFYYFILSSDGKVRLKSIKIAG